MKPFSPQEAKNNAVVTLPSELIEAVNQLLSENYSSYITLTYPQIKTRYESLVSSPLGLVHDWHPKVLALTFKNAGWDVDIDSPGYNESYDTRYIFKQS